MEEAQTIGLSGLDERRFGVRAAKALFCSVTEVQEGLSFCREHGVTFLIARCHAECFDAAHALEYAGCYLTDVLVYYRFDLTRRALPLDPGTATVRSAGPADVDAVTAVARRAFRGYHGHYHADPRLDASACDEVYVDWARRSCLSRSLADEVLVADDSGKVVGFVTLRLNNAEEGEIVLIAVAPSAQRNGTGTRLVVGALKWCSARKARRVVISTQLTNVAAQKTYVRVGFEPNRSYLTFHGWFEG